MGNWCDDNVDTKNDEIFELMQEIAYLKGQITFLQEELAEAENTIMALEEKVAENEQ